MRRTSRSLKQQSPLNISPQAGFLYRKGRPLKQNTMAKKPEYITADEITAEDIVLVKGVSLLAVAIKDFQAAQNKEGASWTHAMKTVGNNGKLFFSESDKFGPRHTPIEKYIDSDRELLILAPKHLDCLFDIQKSFDFSDSYCGQSKYDDFGLVKRAVKYTKIFINNKIGYRLFGKSYIMPKDTKFMCGVWVGYQENCLYGTWPGWANTDPIDFYQSPDYDHYLLKR